MFSKQLNEKLDEYHLLNHPFYKSWNDGKLTREIIKDCEDIDSDEGRNTLPMRVGLENARMISYVIVMFCLVMLYLPHWLGPLDFNQLLIQSPAILLLITLNGPLFKGEDYIVQQRIRMGMLLGLLAFAIEVSI